MTHKLLSKTKQQGSVNAKGIAHSQHRHPQKKGKYKKKAQTDPLGPEGPSKKAPRRVLRGGSWVMFTSVATVATRNAHQPDRADSNIGMRLVRTAAPAQ